MSEKPKATKAAAKRAISRTSKRKQRQPTHNEIAERAYYIHIDESHSDELANWLRAERELAAA